MQEMLHASNRNEAINPDIRGALAQLLTEARSALPASPADAEYCINRAAELLSQAQDIIACDKLAVNPGGLAPWQARRAEAMIEKTLGGRLSIGSLAEAVRLSPGHFRRAFRHTFGIAPHGYILQRRIEHAKTLMLTTNDPLAEIALACGLADQSHFSSVFRRIERESPNAWRRRHRHAPAD